jgi:hypothetical protein
MSVRLALVTALGLTSAMACAGTATAGKINPGDLIVVDRGNGNPGSGILDDINPTTGAVNFVIATGLSPFDQGLAIDAKGTIYASDITNGTISKVDPTTGTLTTFSGNGVGTGPALIRPFEMQFFGGTLYVADGGTPSLTNSTTGVYAIDANGNRTLVAGNNGTPNSPFAQSLAGLAVSPAGAIFASQPTAGHTIYQVGSGTASPLTSAVTSVQGLAFGTNGQLLAVSAFPGSGLIASIDPTTGNTTTLSDNSGMHGSGPAFDSLKGITVGNGLIYVTDIGNNEIFQVDPTNGNRTVLAGNGVGGTTFGALTYGIGVYPTITTSVPEPSGLALLALGAVGLSAYTRRRAGRRSGSPA